MINITNSYVNLLRYVSANGKKSVIEILPQAVKKGTHFKYAGPAEYKSVPIGMPQERPGVGDYKTLENLMLNNGCTKSNALDCWFYIFTPREIKLNRLEQEIRNCYKKENIDKMEFFRTLSPEEKDYIIEAGTKFPDGRERKIVSTDDITLFATLTGHKPAWYCEHGFYRKIDFSKIKQNPKIADNFDVVNLPNNQLYFLNKKEVLKIIEENKDVYCAAQSLSPSESIETVYQTLLKNLEQGKTGHALFGMTLGFPRHSSMIFEMERILDGAKAKLRDNIPEFKEKLLELLHSEQSPYREYPKETLERLEKHIREMSTVGGGSKNLCQCITFGNEEKAVEHFRHLEKDFNENFKVEDLM